MKSAHLAVINADVITMNPSKPRAQAMAVLDSKIVEVGSKSEIQSWIGKSTVVLDLKGKTVVPGLIDTHVHMADFGRSLNWLDLRDAKSIKEVQFRLQKRLQKTQKGNWIIGRGWDQDRLKERRYPTRWDLDEVSPDNPVILRRVCGHVGVANSIALNFAGISRDTPTPQSGQIDKDPHTGEPTGILRETANDLVLNAMPRPNEEDLKKCCQTACKRAVEAGLTGVHWIINSPVEIHILQKLRREGMLPLRVYLIVPVEVLSTFADAGLCTGFSDDVLKLGGVKIFVDGSLGARTAALNKPYEDDPKTKGIMYCGLGQLEDVIIKVQKAGFQACVHAIGDRAVTAAVGAFEKALGSAAEGEGLRHRLEHGSVLNKRLIDRLKRLHLTVAVQPHFIVSDFWIEARLGKARAKLTYPFKTLIENKVTLAGGSDCPVEPINPFLGVYALIARESFPEERITVQEALRIYTVNAAYASFDEDDKGSIEVGKLADLAVLSQNPLTVAPEKVRDIEVEITIVGGKIVHSKSAD